MEHTPKSFSFVDDKPGTSLSGLDLTNSDECARALSQLEMIVGEIDFDIGNIFNQIEQHNEITDECALTHDELERRRNIVMFWQNRIKNANKNP